LPLSNVSDTPFVKVMLSRRLSRGALALVFLSALPACFAFFSLDGYGPSDGSSEAGGDAEAASDVAIVDADAAPTTRIVFVTSTTHAGTLNGLAGADKICNDRASSVKLRGTYHAWLSDRAASPRTRFPALAALADAGEDAILDGSVREPAIVQVDGTLVASGFYELLAKGPRIAIIVSEKGETLDAGGSPKGQCDQTVWTNTNRTGASKGGGSSCNDWDTTDTFERGFAGTLGAASAPDWTDSCQKQCTTAGHLYCFED